MTEVKVGDKFGERVVIELVPRRTCKRYQVIVRCDANLSIDCVKSNKVDTYDLTRNNKPTKTCRPCAYAYQQKNTPASDPVVKRVPKKFVHKRPGKPAKLPTGLCSAAAAILRGNYSEAI